MHIGVMDSGIGGLHILLLSAACLPLDTFAYYADVDHAPYGLLSVSEVQALTLKAVQCLYADGAHAVLLACNTATLSAGAFVRSQVAIPIIGTEPAIRPAVTMGAMRRILMLTTELSAKSKRIAELVSGLEAGDRVDLLPMQQLVTWAEQGNYAGADVKRYLLDRFETLEYPLLSYGDVVLGCTHFNYFTELLRTILGEQVHFVDGNSGVLRRLISILGVETLSVEAVQIRLQQTLSASDPSTVLRQLIGRCTFYYSDGRKLTDAQVEREIVPSMMQVMKLASDSRL
jgi:glutamate racemase